MCILPNDRLTNRISVSLFVNCTLHTGLPSLTYMHQLGFREVLPLPLEEVQWRTSSPKESEHQQWLFIPLCLSSVCCNVTHCIQLHLKVNNLVLGPALGPVAGGFIAEKLGIKWVFIVLAGLPITTSIPHSANILGLSSCWRCCKHHRNPFLEGNLRAYHPTKTRSTISRPRSRQSRCNPFTRKQIPCVVD